MIKAILSDFDGTLVDKNLKYDPQIKELINKIKNKGIRFSLATGRAYYGPVQKLSDELKIYDYHILHGGAMIMHNKTKKTIWIQSISQTSVKKITNYFTAENLFFALETRNYSYLSKLTEVPLYIDAASSRHLSDLDNYHDVLKIVLTISVNYLTESQADKHLDYLE